MATRVYIAGALHEEAIEDFLAHEGFTVTYRPDRPREEVLGALGDVHVLVTRSETRVDRQLLDHAPELKAVVRAAVGVGNIDIDYATEKGVLVINCPGKNTNSAAELTMALVLAMLRNMPQAHFHLKEGGWDRARFKGRELRHKRIGIVGLGNVGHRVARFAHGFEMEVSAYDPYISPGVFSRHGAVQCGDLHEMAAAVDVLTVHVPLNKETQGLLDKSVLDRLPAGAYVVNTSRGGVVDEGELVARLDDGRLAGVAIDTWENEPAPLRELVAHQRTWCSPHIGASTVEAQIAIGKTAFEQTVKAVDGFVVDHPVNLPQVGEIKKTLVKSYAVLAEKMGSLVGQLLTFNPGVCELAFQGDLAGLDHAILRLAFMKGYASRTVDGYVSFVNVAQHFARAGIRVVEVVEDSLGRFKSALHVRVLGQGTHSLRVSGVVFDDTYMRISAIDDFVCELDPEGRFVVVVNEDRPGVIGEIGGLLGSRGINIDSFALSRDRQGGRALALVKVDNPVSPEDVRAISDLAHIISVHAMTL